MSKQCQLVFNSLEDHILNEIDQKFNFGDLLMLLGVSGLWYLFNTNINVEPPPLPVVTPSSKSLFGVFDGSQRVFSLTIASSSLTPRSTLIGAVLTIL